jgi:tetratricopeptide (TPR) repeat protein
VRSLSTNFLVALARDERRPSCHHASVADWEQPGKGLGVRTIGDRVRTLRRSAGLSQAELAAGRFSKEYVSQIERGKTRPTPETLEWLAGRLDTDREYLELGVSKADAEKLDVALREAERLTQAAHYEDALGALRDARGRAGATAAPSVSLRLLRGEAWVRIRTGELAVAMSLLEKAAGLAVSPGLTDLDRAEVVFQVGVVRYSESRINEAIVLFGEALVLAGADESTADRLRSDIFHWRSRCHRRNRDWVAAEEDIERALELAEACGDDRRVADALFQASLVAQREGRWVLARTHAERARELFDRLGDRATVARLLNNLAGLSHLLGDDEHAVELLEEAFGLFVDLDLSVEAGYVCSSLAGIQLDSGDLDAAERSARKALDLLGDRIDHLQEIGMAQLNLGRAHAGRGALDEAEEWIARADDTFRRAKSTGHRSYAWLAQGDVESLRGSDAAAAGLYRRAAVALREEE